MSELGRLHRVRWIGSKIVLASSLLAACTGGRPEIFGESEDRSGEGSSRGDGNGSKSDGGPGGGGVLFGDGSASPPRGEPVHDGGRWEPGTDGACFETEQEPARIVVDASVVVKRREPIAMVILQDRSSSMVGQCDTGVACNANAWNETTRAIRDFVNDPASKGIDVGIGFFPPLHPLLGLTQGACDGTDCGSLAVEPRPLPGNASPVSDALAIATPTTGPLFTLYTPTECALNGVTDYCRAFTRDTGEKCVGVLITDGTPNQCATDTQSLAAIAAGGLRDGIKTFTIGMTAANFTLLDAVARAGGTDCDPQGPGLACNVSNGTSILEALTRIREFVEVTENHTEVHTTELDCEWEIPPPPPGKVFDPYKVNVSFGRKGAGEKRVDFVGGPSGCKGATGGWYFDDDDDLERIVACPKTCSEVRGIVDGGVRILFGCARQEDPSLR